MSTDQLIRTVFATSRAAEFLERRALQSQTGQPAQRFGDVVVKELLDNALDAAESHGVQPEITVGATVAGDTQQITVIDNGPGMPVEVVERITDFNVLVSDKAAYRSPTRGLQGNAWKTLLGIPYALDLTDPVVIEACGVRHEIAASIDPAGAVAVRHDTAVSARTVGTAVTVPLPIAQSVDIGRWLQSFAIVNPHAALIQLAIGRDPDSRVFYKPTAGDSWRKPTPTDPTSPHWYDRTALKRLVFAHIGAIRAGADDVPLGEFIRSFEGLKSTGKAKTVKAAIPWIERLSDFERDADAIAVLLEAMRVEARAPKPAVLGEVPEEHYRDRIDEAYGVERFWFRRKRLDVSGLPWLLEVAIAETTRPGAIVYGVNYSATFGDPFSATRLRHDDIRVMGAGSFLAQADAAPGGWGDDRRAAVIHVACPALEFTDKGKVALTVPDQVAETFAAMLGSATKDLRAEYKRAERDARAEANRREQRRRAEPRITLKDAVFEVMRDAIRHASGGGTLPVGTRTLYYAVRPRIQALTHAELKMDYFSQTLVVEWERLNGPVPGFYRDPRGELREPHTGGTVRLGTREIADYRFPDHLYDKILYVEKEGLNPVFEAARLAERYDMAIAGGKGQPVEAVRDLFARAGDGDVKLFVLHDADWDGYTIARVIGEETARMPDHHVQVIDLGLTVADAIHHQLPTEKATRKKELPYWMPPRLSDAERDWFEGRQISRKQWECTRVELNAFTSDQLIDYIETGLRAHDATAKVVPPADVITGTAKAQQHSLLGDLIDRVISDLIDVDAIINALTEETAHLVDVGRDDIVEALADNPPIRWKASVEKRVDRALDEAEGNLRQRVHTLLAEQGIGGTP